MQAAVSVSNTALIDAAIDHASKVLELVIPLETVSSLPVPKATVGLLLNAMKQSQGLSWAMSTNNRPVGMACFRIISEIQISAGYILEVPEFSDYRAGLLLLESPRRHLRVLQSKHMPVHMRSANRAQDELALIAFEQQVRDELASLPKGPADPDQWAKAARGAPTTTIWDRAKVGNWEALYVGAYEVASAYVHADGLAIDEMLVRLKTGLPAENDGGMAWKANVASLFLMDLSKRVAVLFPSVNNVPGVVESWNRYVQLGGLVWPDDDGEER